MSSKKHVITYPGFAEGANAKGLYTDLESEYSPSYQFHILPFYEELPSGDRLIHSIAEHAQAIQDYMDELDGEVMMLAKCGGTRPTIAMDDEHIGRLSLLCLFNPPWKVSRDFLEEQFTGWKGTRRSDGSWAIPRSQTGDYVVSTEYMNDASTTDLKCRYSEIARSSITQLFIVRALEDEVFPPIKSEMVGGNVTFINIEGGDHHLTGAARRKVLGALAVYSVL